MYNVNLYRLFKYNKLLIKKEIIFMHKLVQFYITDEIMSLLAYFKLNTYTVSKKHQQIPLAVNLNESNIKCSYTYMGQLLVHNDLLFDAEIWHFSTKYYDEETVIRTKHNFIITTYSASPVHQAIMSGFNLNIYKSKHIQLSHHNEKCSVDPSDINDLIISYLN